MPTDEEMRNNSMQPFEFLSGGDGDDGGNGKTREKGQLTEASAYAVFADEEGADGCEYRLFA